ELADGRGADPGGAAGHERVLALHAAAWHEALSWRARPIIAQRRADARARTRSAAALARAIGATMAHGRNGGGGERQRAYENLPEVAGASQHRAARVRELLDPVPSKPAARLRAEAEDELVGRRPFDRQHR